MIRQYKDFDYEQLKELYQHFEWYGGQFDEARDSREKLDKITAEDPDAILVYEMDEKLIGSISLIEDGRVAWLFRFVVRDNDPGASKELYKRACEILRERGHTQVIVYSPQHNKKLDERYAYLGMLKGNEFTAYWTDI
jgi:hypothetical protein